MPPSSPRPRGPVSRRAMLCLLAVSLCGPALGCNMPLIVVGDEVTGSGQAGPEEDARPKTPPAPRQRALALLGGRVKLGVPPYWRIERQEYTDRHGAIDLAIPAIAPAAQAKETRKKKIATATPAATGRAVVIGDVLDPASAGAELDDEERAGGTTLSDARDGATWRTLVRQRDGAIPQVVLGRFGVENGVRVELLVTLDLPAGADPAFVEGVVADFNRILCGLRIDGHTSCGSQVTIAPAHARRPDGRG